MHVLSNAVRVGSRPVGIRRIGLPALCCFALLAATGLRAEFSSPDGNVSIRSTSGQFVAYGSPASGRSLIDSRLIANTNLVRLQPALLVVTCERIKQLLLFELGAKDQWRGKVHLTVRPARNGDDEIVLSSDRFRDGWNYRLSLPDAVESQRLLDTLVQVMLLEMANRGAGERLAELPLWLAVGMTENLRLFHGGELILRPPSELSGNLPVARMTRERRLDQVLAQSRAPFTNRAPLTFDQLSWPAAEQLTGAEGDFYRASAQFFLSQLVRMEDGRACLRAFLAELPRRLNWQTAFLHAFGRHFGRLLDAEKWWALQAVHQTSRNSSQTWPVEESHRKLAAILRAQVQVRMESGDLPLQTDVPLQTILREGGAANQVRVLQEKIVQLRLLRLRAAPGVFPLVDDYLRALETCLENFDRSGKAVKAASRKDLDETIRQLDALDAVRDFGKQLPVTAKQEPPAEAPQ